MHTTTDQTADAVAAALQSCELPKAQWTHDNHILACVSLVRTHGAAGALRILRTAIPRYNEATGVANTTTSGYHETLTVYYVWAIHRLLADGRSATEILADPTVTREAALVFWPRDTLFSTAARLQFVPPSRVHDDNLPTDRFPAVS